MRCSGADCRFYSCAVPRKLKSEIESLSGLSMDCVRVDYNSSRPAQLNANAYAQGLHIHILAGESHLRPHEGRHVGKQAQGRVQATMQAKGVALNDGKALMRLMRWEQKHFDCAATYIPDILGVSRNLVWCGACSAARSFRYMSERPPNAAEQNKDKQEVDAFAVNETHGANAGKLRSDLIAGGSLAAIQV
jgi:hypothetical protein